MAAEYVAKEGNERVILCERGIKTFERSTRFTLDLSAVPVLKRETHLPVLVDPSHAAGRSDLVLPLARAAVAVGRRRRDGRGSPAARGRALRRAAADPRRRVRPVRRRDPHARRAHGQDRRVTRRVRCESSPCRPSSGTSPCRATSRSRTGPSSSARSARARRGSRDSGARRTRRRRSPRSARSASRSWRRTSTRCAFAASGSRGLRAPAGADRLRERGHAHAAARRASSPARRAGSSSSATSRSPRARWSASPSRSAGWAPTSRRRDGHAPLVVEGAPLRAIDYELPVASAQVKSAVLLAGLQADGTHDGRRAGPDARPHRAPARACRARVSRAGRRASRSSVRRALRLADVEIPGDISSAAPFLVAAAIVPGSARHGARGRAQPAPDGPARRARAHGREDRDLQPAADRRRAGAATSRCARPISSARPSRQPRCPALIDELPLLAVAACHARGETVVRGAAELRAKESDRIEAVVEELRRIGGHIRATRDGFRIRGVPARLRGGVVDSRGDHRLAMLGAVAGVASREGVELRGAEAVGTSFPGFFEVLAQVAPGAVHYPPAT